MLFTRLVKIHQPIFLRSAQSIIEKLNYKRWFLGLGREGGRIPSVISLCEMPPPPKVEALAKRAGFVLIGQRQEEVCR